MDDQSKIIVYLDDEPLPVASFKAPVYFELDTQKMTDGEHVMKIISQDPAGREGIRYVRFEVRNGPAIAISGLSDHQEVDGILPIMINAYGKGDQRKFLITGSESPRSVPTWIWALFIALFAWIVYFVFTSLNM